MSSAGEGERFGGVRRARSPRARAAIGATAVVIVATFPLWYGALIMTNGRFPSVPPVFALVYLLGLPGLYAAGRIGDVLGLPYGDPRVLLAIPLAWLFYFALFRGFIYLGKLARVQHGEAERRGE